MQYNEFEDNDLGRVIIAYNSRARNVIARKKPGFIQLTVPSFYSKSQIDTVFEKLKPRLLNIEVKPELIFSPDTQFESLTFRVEIETRDVKNFHVNLSEGVLHIVCPRASDYYNPMVQSTIRNCIENTLRHEAKRIFPERLKALAETCGFNFTEVKINKSRTRWGSCNSKKAINLSYFCLLLPANLIDFILLHELCHTIEMNHGERFWQLLDKVTDGRARELTRTLKQTKINW